MVPTYEPHALEGQGWRGRRAHPVARGSNVDAVAGGVRRAGLRVDGEEPAAGAGGLAPSRQQPPG